MSKAAALRSGVDQPDVLVYQRHHGIAVGGRQHEDSALDAGGFELIESFALRLRAEDRDRNSLRITAGGFGAAAQLGDLLCQPFPTARKSRKDALGPQLPSVHTEVADALEQLDQAESG